MKLANQLPLLGEKQIYTSLKDDQATELKPKSIKDSHS